MRTKALKTFATTGAAMLLLTACGSSTGAETGGETPAPTQTSATATAAAAPQLESGQSDQELAFDFIDALNTWWHTDQERLAEELPADATPEQIAETAMDIAEEHREEFSQALLVDDFDTRRPRLDTLLTTDDLVAQHASYISHTIDGHRNFELDDNGEIFMYGDEKEGYKLTLVVAQPVRPQADGSMHIKVHLISDPNREDSLPFDVRPIVATFETDGDVERLAAMQWT